METTGEGRTNARRWRDAGLAGLVLLAPALAAPATQGQVPGEVEYALELVNDILEDPLDPLTGSEDGGTIWAFFPTISQGNRGEDVRAAQYLLSRRGFATDKDGVFDAGLRSTVISFQQSRGIAADGIIGPQTWGKLILTVQYGSTGDAVRGLQVQLNEKRFAGLAVDGIFGSLTRGAVRTFQSHMGITVDGIVGPQTWRYLLWHYHRVLVGGNICDYHSPDEPQDRWGTAATTGQLLKAAADFVPSGNGLLALGDVSREHGGDIAGHRSHEMGMDADIRPVRMDSNQCNIGVTWCRDYDPQRDVCTSSVTNPAYDRAATRALIDILRSTGRVKTVLFNDPVLRQEGRTTVWPGHENHLHVRYCVAVHPDPDYRC